MLCQTIPAMEELNIDDDTGLMTGVKKPRLKRKRCTCRTIGVAALTTLTITSISLCGVVFFGGYNIHSFSLTTASLEQSVHDRGGREPLRIVCIILTTPSNWKTKGRAVQNTWARKCFLRVFFYSRSNDSRINEAVALDVAEGRDYLTEKVLSAFQYAFDNYSEQVDWFLKADDDTFFIWENLEKMLSQFNTSTPRYIGKTIATHLASGYNSGGAGYVLSKRAMKTLLEADSRCKKSGGLEDLNIGKCLALYHVFPENTLDPNGFLTFNSDNPAKVIRGTDQDLTMSYYLRRGKESFGNPGAKQMMFSPNTVSFHYVEPEEMYMYDFFLYMQ